MIRSWHVALGGLALFIALRLALPALGTMPRALTAEEADALLGARLLTERLAPSEHAPDAPLGERLRSGFSTTPENPRLQRLPPERTAQRAAVEAPLPRWLGALGIGVLPTSADATNLERASTASALAVALALACLFWALRRERLLVPIVAIGALIGTPGLIDAALSAGHGASAILVSTLFALALERVARRRGGFLAQLALGLLVGLALAIHPSALVLWPVILVAWALHARPSGGDTMPPPPRGTLTLPAAPLLLFAVPLIALVVLVALWPALWNETGKRLGAWLLDFGSTQSPPHEVLGQVFDQAAGKSAQAFTAVLQWVAWTPLPILGLWLVGFAAAVRRGRAGAWTPILTLVAWLVVGALDGGLFSARNSLLALLWVPTAIAAAHGAGALSAYIERQLPRLTSSSLARRLAALSPNARAALLVTLLLIAPLMQAARGTTFGMARQTGAELRAPLPLALIHAAAASRPWPIIAAAPRSEDLAPALEAAREGMSLDLHVGTLAEADLVIASTATGASPPPALEARLAAAREVFRDARPGLVVALWNLAGPAPLDKRPALPHN